METLRRTIQTSLALVLVLAGVFGIVYLVKTRPEPPRAADAAPVPEVKAYELTPQTFDEPVVAYGTIRPVNQVRIIPQVSGMLVDMHPDLAVGKMIEAGEVLFQIDRRPYESQVKQVEADIKLLEVQLARLDQQKNDLQKRLTVAREQLALADEDLDREIELLQKSATRDVEVDAARQKSLQFQDLVMGYEGQLALIPHQRAEVEARLEARRAQLDDARRNLDSTEITCPFDARVDLISAKTAQVVVANLAIAVLTDLSALELPAVLDPSQLRWTDHRAYARAFGGDEGEPPLVDVTWAMHGQRFVWEGHISRFERHDEATRTARLVVEVPQSLEEIRASRVDGKPPLAVGMFCSAEIPAEPLEGALVLSRSAIREGNLVHVFRPDQPGAQTGRLALREVPILRNVEDRVLVDFKGRYETGRLLGDQADAVCDLSAGELVIVSPIPRAVAGMKLQLRPDHTEASLALQNPRAADLATQSVPAVLANLAAMQPAALPSDLTALISGG